MWCLLLFVRIRNMGTLHGHAGSANGAHGRGIAGANLLDSQGMHGFDFPFLEPNILIVGPFTFPF